MRKSRGKYTILNGVDVMPWRKVAKTMREEEDMEMNTATARNIFIRAMAKLLVPVLEANELEYTKEEVKAAAESEEWQLFIYDILTNKEMEENE
jgi:hypothetical protein